MTHTPENYPQLDQLLNQLVEGECRQPQMRQICDILRHDPQARRLYLEYLNVHGTLMWDVAPPIAAIITPHTQEPEQEADRNHSAHPVRVESSFFLEVLEQEKQAARQRAQEQELAEQQHQAEEVERHQRLKLLWGISEKPVKPIKHIVIPKPVFYGAIAAVVALTAMLFGPAQQPTTPVVEDKPTASQLVQVATIVEQIDAEWSGGSHTPALGSALFNEPIQLVSGLAKLRFNGEAEVILEAPCSIEPISGGKVEMTRGKLVGKCETVASRGFVVQTPSARIVDLGTEFSVEVSPQGASSVQVRQGAVEVTLTGNDGTFRRSVRLTTDQSAKIDPAAETLLVSRRALFVLPNTGREAQAGEVDPHWRIIYVTGKISLESAAHVVAPGMPGGGENWLPTNEHSKWLAPASQVIESKTIEGRFIFETTFTVGDDVDPDSIEVHGRFSADDGVSSIELNGQPVTAGPFEFSRTEQGVFVGSHEYWQEFEIKQGFIKGPNVLRFVVNNPPYKDGEDNVMGFRAQFEGSAVQTFQVAHD